MKEKSKTIEERFKKLSPIEHILQRPSMYISSIINEIKDVFVVDNMDELKIIKKSINFNRGFFAIVDEVLTNASDAFIRNGNVKNIKIIINNDHIIVENDGSGIPIEIHKKEKIYVPELIFSHLHSGENFTDSDERLVAGTHGLGVKLTNIFSKKFIVETSDGKNKYYQEFFDNMSKKTKPKISTSKKNYTKITFYPDFERFGLIKMTDDIKSVILRRCVDISVYCQGVKIYFNNILIPVKNFKDYMKLFVNDDSELFTEKINDDWEIGISKSPDNSFNQVSIVNGITTYNGGTHVNAIINNLTKRTQEILIKKYKNLNIKQNDIKNNVFLFVSTKISNPAFDTQTKENLITKIINIPEISEKLIKQFTNSQIIDDVIKFLHIKEQVNTKKEIGKHKIKISKLDDAKKAGTRESDKCILMITEGDSAQTSCISGLSEVDASYFGVMPIRGKILNVRDANLQKIRENEEIKNIINVLGLEFGKTYLDTSKLRYGKVVFFADMDSDGSHIKGLLINFIDTFWPDLLKLNFIHEFITPIMKIYDDKKFIKYFYRMGEWEKYRNENDTSKYQKKYFKGLGTILPEEMKYFFKNINKHLIKFHYDIKIDTEDLIDLTFNTKRSNDRKDWMKNYDPNNFIDKFTVKQTYDKFINSELMEFSMMDNIRTIPNILDGLKQSQRKVIYTMFKNKHGEIKVSSLSGSVIQSSSYHHGDSSLNQTIIGMAQDFVGTNNINLLLPKGQFGSRLKGGGDSASPRYIFTKLNDLTPHIYKKEDNNILDYKNDDGFLIEPNYYIPIIPMILVNGSAGIGYGYSTDIPSFNPIDIIIYLQNKINNKKNIELNPYYKYFKGSIKIDIENNRYISRGIMNKLNEHTFEIKELPLWTWNDKYYEFLDDLSDDKKDPKTGKLIRKAYIRDWIKDGNEKDIKIKIYLTKDVPKEFIKDIWRSLKMESYISFSNMHLFDAECKIKKYVDQYEIIDDFYKIRMEYYVKRKIYQLGDISRDIKIIQNRIKFLKIVIDGNLVIYKRTRDLVEKDLEKLLFDKVDDSYGYLLGMSIMSFTKEKLIELKEEYDKTKLKYKELNETSEENIWLKELAELKSKIKF